MAVDPNKLFGRNLPKSSRTDNQRSATSGSKDAAGSFLSLNKNIFAINKNLTAIAELITKQAKQEKDADKLDAEARRKQEDDEKKKNAESVLEKIVSNTVIKPLQSIKKGLGNIFERIFKALGSLFAGYVGMKGIEGIKDWLQGDKSTLKELANEVKLVLGAAAGVFLAMNVGIPLISSALGGVIGSVVSGLPGVLGLLGNPMVWMGIIAAAGIVYSGTELYRYLSGEYGSAAGGFSGRGSFSEDRKFYVDRVIEVGQEEAINEMDRKMAKLAERYPALFTEKNGKLVPKNIYERGRLSTFDGALSAANNDLQDILNAKEDIAEGRYDRFDVAKLSKKDQEALNTVMPLIEKAKNNWALFKGKQLEITALLDGKAYSELSGEMQKIADKLYEEQVVYKNEIVGALLDAKEINDNMSPNGRDFLNAVAQKNDITRLFGRKDGWKNHLQVGPFNPNSVQKRDVLTIGMKPSAVEHFDKIMAVDSDLDRIIPKGLIRAGFDPEKISPTTSIIGNNSLSSNTGKVENGITQNDIFASGNIFSDKNLEVASKFSSSLDTPQFEIVPIDFTGDSSSGAVTETFTPQDYDPAMFDFATSNLANDDYINLFSSQIGIYDYDN